MNFNDDLFAVVSTIFDKHDEPVRFQETEPWSDSLWQQLVEGGFTTIGREAAIEDHAAIAKAVGKYAIALPVVEAGLARWVADHAGLSLDDDAIVVCAGLAADDRVQLERLDSGSYRLSGSVRRVPWGRHADAILVPAKIDGGMCWVLVGTEQLEPEPSVNYAGEPRDGITFAGQQVAADQVGSTGPQRKEVRARAALLRAASGVGAMEFVLDSTLVHAEQRSQFGRPISSFQAVQHHLVAIAEAVASVSAAADAAVFAAPEQRLMMVAAAKVMLGEQAAILSRVAHQVHGAIGTTEEHPLQARTRRLWSWQDEYGTTSDWAVELADQLVFEDSPGAWQVLTPPLPVLETRDVAERFPW